MPEQQPMPAERVLKLGCAARWASVPVALVMSWYPIWFMIEIAATAREQHQPGVYIAMSYGLPLYFGSWVVGVAIAAVRLRPGAMTWCDRAILLLTLLPLPLWWSELPIKIAPLLG